MSVSSAAAARALRSGVAWALVSSLGLTVAVQVCQPLRDVTLTEEGWSALRAKWAAQQESPFVQYKLMKVLPDGEAPVELSEEDYAELEKTSHLAREWLSLAPDRSWVKTACEVMKKLRGLTDVRLYLCVPVPGAGWSPQLTSNYLSIVHHPNNLGSIEQQLKDGQLSTPDAWVASVRTVFRNVFVYNAPKDPISKAVLAAAELASRVFETEMMRLRGVIFR